VSHRQLIDINSLDDPRLAPYRNIKERELARMGGRFIAEGEHLVRRLMVSDFSVESVLLARRRAEEIAPLVRHDVPVYIVPDELIHHVLGIRFHSGVIACGVRKPPLRLSAAIPPAGPAIVVVLPEISNVENLGSIVRLAAAFGAAALVLGPRSHDPFWRQSVRVSMGTVFTLPIVRSDDLLRDLQALRDEHGMELIATVVDERAEALAAARRRPRSAILLGSEAQGLDRQWIDLCERRITIPMHLGTDSLNVATAAAVVLYHFTNIAPITSDADHRK
jgi:tRNA G18 (ribose-2'-O)-methylase SpoU